MKLAILADVHFGVRNENPTLLKATERFFTDQFFPYLDQHNIKTIINCGDLLDRRKYINYLTYKSIIESFIKPMKERGIEVHSILGNHDVFYRTSNELNSIRLIFDKEDSWFHVYEHPTNLELGGKKFGMVSWLSQDNNDEMRAFIKTTDADMLIAHFELAGFDSQVGITMKEGMNIGDLRLDRFARILCGHYHHRQQKGNIFYLGQPHEHTWADYNDPKGFHVYDTETDELTFIKNDDRLFCKIQYDSEKNDYRQITKESLEKYCGKFVKVEIVNNGDQAVLEGFLEKLASINPEKYTVADNTTLIESEVDLTGDENALVLIHQHIEETTKNKEIQDHLKTLMGELWKEANTE